MWVFLRLIVKPCADILISKKCGTSFSNLSTAKRIFMKPIKQNFVLIAYSLILLIAEYHRRNDSKTLFFRYQITFL